MTQIINNFKRKYQIGGALKAIPKGKLVVKMLDKLLKMYPDDARYLKLKDLYKKVIKEGDSKSAQQIEKWVTKEEQFNNFVQTIESRLATPQTAQAESKTLQELYNKNPWELTDDEVTQLRDLSRKANGLSGTIDERTPSLAGLMPEGAVDTRYIYRNPTGSYDDLPTYLPTALWRRPENYYKKNGGKLKKFQNPSGPIYFSTNYGTVDPYALRENPYKVIKKGTPGLAYDAVNAGLYLAAPFTGGATTIPAMVMSGAKGAGAVADMVENNIDPHNFIDALSTAPIMSFGPMVLSAAKNAKLMRQFGKALMPKTTIQPTKVITQKVVSKYPPYIYRGQVLQHPGLSPEIMYNSNIQAAKPFFKEASRLSRDAMVGTGVQELTYTPVIAADMVDENK